MYFTLTHTHTHPHIRWRLQVGHRSHRKLISGKTNQTSSAAWQLTKLESCRLMKSQSQKPLIYMPISPHQLHWPPNLNFLYRCTKGTLLPVLVLNTRIVQSGCNASGYWAKKAHDKYCIYSRKVEVKILMSQSCKLMPGMSKMLNISNSSTLVQLCDLLEKCLQSRASLKKLIRAVASPLAVRGKLPKCRRLRESPGKYKLLCNNRQPLFMKRQAVRQTRSRQKVKSIKLSKTILY